MLHSTAMDEASAILSENEQADVTMFLDAGEYGIALETFGDILREGGKRLPVELATRFRAIGVGMGLDAEVAEGTSESDRPAS